MQAGAGDEAKTAASARRAPTAVYGTAPRPIPEAAGAVTRSLNTLEGINRAYDQIIAEKEAAWRNLDTRGVNPRSQEGRALTQEKGALYIEWKKAEREKTKAVAAWYRARNEAAYAQSPDALIDVAVEDARGFVQGNGYTKQNYPKNSGIGRITTAFGSMEELFVYSGSSLNYLTKYSGQEHMCGIYMLDQGDGNSEYIMGPVFTGEPNNVIIPYIASTFAAEGYTDKLSNMYHGGASPVPGHSAFASEP